MPLKIAVASGKGGTGKTTVSVNLQYFISKYWNKKVLLVDCDVEEPNDKIFFENAKNTEKRESEILIPYIDQEKCTFCRKCVEWCEFNAIVVIPPVKFAQVNESLCHSCGACLVACDDDAITESPVSIGQINKFDTGVGNGLFEGSLKIGSAMQTMVIADLKKEDTKDSEIILYDAPPGTSCPVVTTVSDADYVILVTEPTPFGLYDLKLTIDLLNDLKKKFGIVVNKAGLGNNDLYEYLAKEEIEILGEIPFDKDYARKYSSGDLLDNISEKTDKTYKDIISKIKLNIS